MLASVRLALPSRALVCGAALAFVAAGALAPPAQAAPVSPRAPAAPKSPAVPATPEVRELKIPAVAAAKQKMADGRRSAGRIVAALPAQTTAKFSTIGVTWARGAREVPKIEVRTRAGGRWSGWQHLEDESTSGPDGTEALKARPGTAPLWVGDSDGVEVRLVAGTDVGTITAPAALSVSLVDPKARIADATVAQTASITAAATNVPHLTPPPVVVSRALWGADEELRSYNGIGCATPRYTSTIKAAIVHHTVGANIYTAASSASQIRGIYAYHVKSQGWCDIGYNFLIDKFGTIFEGRFGGIANPVRGAHSTSWNTDTVGVSLMGNFDTAKPTAAMLDSTAKVIAWKLEGNYRRGTGTVTLAGKTINIIAGHGDVMPTACPGLYLRARMSDLRATVSTKIGSYNTPIYRRWQSLGGEAGWVGSPFVGEHAVTPGRVTRFTNADLYYHPTLGTFWTKGANRNRYRSLGETKHHLGWPISDQEPGVLGSQLNRFQRGGIYYSTATGSQVVFKAFYTYYSSLGANTVRLGLPTASRTAGGLPGTQVQKFAKGGLYWTQAAGVQEVNGEIYKAYLRVGGEKSRLGMPTRGDYAVAGGRSTTFQGGKITWSFTTNQTTVTYS